MADIKHVAMMVKDANQTAEFYEQIFDMKRVSERDAGDFIRAKVIDLTDGSLTVTLICPDDQSQHRDWAYKTWGVNHIGFVVDDFKGTIAKLRERGINVPQNPPKPFFKFRDMNGTEIDVASPEYDEWKTA